MFVWLFKEMIDFLLCQGVAFTVLLIIIHELFVYVFSIIDLLCQGVAYTILLIIIHELFVYV